jgi:hypothetical protein
MQLTVHSRELLGYSGDWFGEPVWPEGYSPYSADLDANEEVVPLAVGGKNVLGRDGDGVVGHDLVPHSDRAVAVFCPGQSRYARAWLEDYGWDRASNFEAEMRKITAALSARRGPPRR